MIRLYEPEAYAAPERCFWTEGVDTAQWPQLEGDAETDIAIIGGGFTGLSCALHLAEAGHDCTLLEAEGPAFGASGRNGGFCCLGGAKAPDRLLRRRFGEEGMRNWHRTEKAAVETVAELLQRHDIDADTHSDGETQLAHTERAMVKLRASVPEIEESLGVQPTLIERDELRQNGMNAGFHGALTIPIGFALHPRKYHAGLVRAALKSGARLQGKSAVRRIMRNGTGWHLETDTGTLRARRVVIATNGYSSEDVPDWLRARTLPALSQIVVTRPLTQAELDAQGWTSRQMAYDTRTLLHYFRLLPDNRFLFGMRGGLSARPRESEAISRRIRADLHAMFPAWRDVEITHEWSGLVCLMANLTPYAGPVPEMPGVFAGLGYHGNGVAMASHTGRILAALATDQQPKAAYPEAMRALPPRFPLGRFRRALLRPTYMIAGALDL